MKTLFLETSAVLAAVLREPRGPEARQRIDDADQLVASRLIHVEANRALIRLLLSEPTAERHLPELHHELRNLWAMVDFVEMTRDVCDRAGTLTPHAPLRTLDAIHLATYYRVRELDPAVELLSFDRRILAEATGV